MKWIPKEKVKGRMDGNTNKRKKRETNQKECIKKKIGQWKEKKEMGKYKVRKGRKKWERTRWEKAERKTKI